MSMQLQVSTKIWPLREPFVISRGSQSTAEVVVVHLREGRLIGRGEAAGVDYHGETLDTLCAQVESVRREVERGISRRELLSILPAGGARNAIDAALWDLEAKRSGRRAWELAGLKAVRPVVTNLTLGIRPIAAYEQRARELASYAWLKIKVDAQQPLEAIRAVRRGSPRARLVVDANQAWSVRQLEELAPALLELRVDLLEQPVPIESDEELAGLDLPIPVCADEPANTAADVPRLVDRYDFVNIKLDKSGGLTAALDLADAARAAGLRLMVGCMVGSSLAMAPAMVVAQLCEVADLDGPLLQAEDWPDAIAYDDGVMQLPTPALWG
jgi:L-alanine-DL-glutamate epimerase-like enolase superfamily enzyme